MKKAVLVVDHKDRDLRGIILIAFWLNRKYNVFPYITQTKNEISCLIKYKPELILLQHVRHEHQQEFLDYAKHQKTYIAVNLAEGFPDHLDNILYYIGRDEYMRYIDVFLPWGERLWELAKKKELLEHASIQPIGSPRFDYHTSRYSELATPQKTFFENSGIDTAKPTLLWTTNFKHCPFGDMEEFIKKYMNPAYSDHRRAPTVRELAISNEQAFNKLSDYFLRLLQEFPDLQFIIKIHPAEPVDVYQKKFGHFRNVILLQFLQDFSLSDLIRYADIQITWRCTTSPEAWLMDLKKKVISIEPPEVDSKMLQHLTVGNDIVSDYPSLKKKIIYYMEAGEVSQDLVDSRLKFIHDYLYSNDGRSAERCADVLYQHLSNAKPKRSLHNYKILLKYLRQYRFNKNWLAMKRDEDHPKHISADEVDAEMKRLTNLFGCKVDYAVEM